jgi:hypothetical protein
MNCSDDTIRNEIARAKMKHRNEVAFYTNRQTDKKEGEIKIELNKLLKEKA